MKKCSVGSMLLLFLTVAGCATSDDRAAVARTVVDAGIVAAAAAGYGSLTPENCELVKPIDRDECLRRNNDIQATRTGSNQREAPRAVPGIVVNPK